MSAFYRDAKNHLTIDGLALDGLMAEFGSPLYVYSGASDGALASSYPYPKHNRPLCTLFWAFCSVAYHLDIIVPAG